MKLEAAAPAMTDEVCVFDCAGTALVGVLSRPAQLQSGAVGVVVVVGGPQYRAGSHRQFVALARRLAAGGFPVLRFDHRGMGDSPGDLPGFEHLEADIGAAIDALLQAVPALQRVVLWGLCDGASAALLSQHGRADPRVAGLCLLNPWVRSVASLAKTQVKHYYRQRLLERAFWAKLLSGGVARKALADLWQNLGQAFGSGAESGSATKGIAADRALGFQQRMALAWQQFDGPILLVLSECDHTAQEFTEVSHSDPLWQSALQRRPPGRVSLSGADHTCSHPAAQASAEAATLQWLRSSFAGHAP